MKEGAYPVATMLLDMKNRSQKIKIFVTVADDAYLIIVPLVDQSVATPLPGSYSTEEVTKLVGGAFREIIESFERTLTELGFTTLPTPLPRGPLLIQPRIAHLDAAIKSSSVNGGNNPNSIIPKGDHLLLSLFNKNTFLLE